MDIFWNPTFTLYHEVIYCYRRKIIEEFAITYSEDNSKTYQDIIWLISWNDKDWDFKVCQRRDDCLDNSTDTSKLMTPVSSSRDTQYSPNKIRHVNTLTLWKLCKCSKREWYINRCSLHLFWYRIVLDPLQELPQYNSSEICGLHKLKSPHGLPVYLRVSHVLKEVRGHFLLCLGQTGKSSIIIVPTALVLFS